jgi:hypothetical protein
MEMPRRARIKCSGIGGDQFKVQIEAALARSVLAGKPGRPRKQGKKEVINESGSVMGVD